MFLIRPDQYIGLRSQPLSMEALRYYLCKKLYINDIRIPDEQAKRVKNMESTDPVPTILLTGLVFTISYVIGNRYLPERYKPNQLIHKLWKSIF